MQYHALDPERIIATAGLLHQRIRERFPDAGLGNVAAELLSIARAHAARSARIREPNWWLRLISAALLVGGLASLALLFWSVRVRVENEWTLAEMIQTLEAGLSMTIFLGAAAVFALNLEQRRKRRRCLEALHELRAMAHIVDMHQLTKDPERVADPQATAPLLGPDTPSSPPRVLTAFELSRYIDYCSEMLSLMGKVAALYVQGFPDPQATDAVDDIENLTTQLSRKIWQKIMILDATLARTQEGKA